MKFELDAEQVAIYEKWRKEQEKIVLDTQLADLANRQKAPDYVEEFPDFLIKSGHPYYGAIGGAVTFTFTPTSIGHFVVATHGYTKAKLDLTGDL